MKTPLMGHIHKPKPVGGLGSFGAEICAICGAERGYANWGKGKPYPWHKDGKPAPYCQVTP